LKLTQNIRIVSVIIISVFIAACSAEKETLENLDTAKKLVENYYESGKFDAECKIIFDDAISQIEKLAPIQNQAVVFDVDETALSNYKHTKEIGFGFVMSLWHEWLLKADAPAIKQTKLFYDYLVSKNIKVIFITGRYSEVKEQTQKNLIDQGYTNYDTLIVRSINERKFPASEFKSLKREELKNKGYNIIASVGDQWSDLVGGNAGIKIKLPNYLYLID